MTTHNKYQRLSKHGLNSLWLVIWFLIASALLFAANLEADRQERVRMNFYCERVTDLARITESIINGKLHEFDNALLVLRDTYVANPDHFAETVKTLRSGLLSDNENIVLMVDRDGYLAYTDATDVNPRLYLGDLIFFRSFADGGKDQFYIDEPSSGRITMRYCLPLARPIYDRQGSFLGVVVIFAKQQSLVDFGPHLQLSGDTTISVVNHGGTIVSRSTNRAKVQETTLQLEFLMPRFIGSDGVFSSRSTPDRVEMVVAYRLIHYEEASLIVYVEASPGKVLQEMSKQRSVLMFGSGFTSLVILILILVYLKGQRITELFIDTLKRSKEQEYKILTGTTLDGFYITDNSGRIVDINDTCCKMLGYTERELLCLSVADIAASESSERVVAHIRSAMEDGSTRFQSQLQCKDGTIVDVEISAQYVNESGGRFFVFIHDITERKRAEKALLESEERYRTVANFTYDWEYWISPEQNFIYCSPSCERITGYSADEFKKDPDLIKAITHPDDRDQFVYHLDGIDKHGPESHEIEIRIFSRSGEERWIAHACRIVRGDDGVFLGRRASNRDITKRKQAQEALVDREQYLQTILQTTADGFWVLNSEGNFVETNEAYCSMSGYTRDELLKLNILTIDAFEGPTESAARIQRIITKASEIFETRHRRKDGSIFDVEISATYLHTNGGKIVCFCRDITNRKQTEDSLRESEEKFRMTFDFSPDAVNINRLYDGLYVDINEGFTRLTGFTRDDVIGRTSLEIEIWHDSADRQKLVQGLLAQGYFENLEAKFRSKDGRLITALMSARVISMKGTPHIISITRDITERKLIEAQLQQAQKMETIGSLAGGIAHDLNNILFPISGLSEILLDEIPPDNPAHDSIDQIHKSAQRGSDLVKQVLAFSRQANPQKISTRIQPILNEALKLARAAMSNNIEITININAECGMVFADSTQLHQVMMNLITNAYHAVEEKGGTIYVGLKEMVFEKDDSLKPGKYACITVYDTGVGIDQSLIQKIFDPYFTTKEQGKGTGLGLSVVHGIVKDHGGEIRVYSEVGKGTTFNVYLPLLEDVKDKKSNTVIRKYPTGCESILLVDDEEPITLMVKMMLERLGYHVTVQTGSPNALAAFKANPSSFDIVISDRSMPNMTGEQLARKIISIRPGIPIILCTGFCDENDKQHAKAMGIKGFLMKPVATGDLAEMVRRVLDEEFTVKTKICKT